MTIKQKFERIDQTKLEQKQVDALKIVLNFTENFKTNDKEKIKITNDKLDAIIGKLQEKNPEALKPIASKTSKPSKKASSTKAPRRNVFSVAKQIQQSGESFEDAKKRAAQQMKGEKASASKVVKNELQSLLAFIEKHKELKGIHGTDIPRDSVRVAKVGGRRISKNGNVYYERRENRMDRLAPHYPKDAPLLEKGAYLTDPTFGNFQEQVYSKGGLLSAKERYILEIKGLTGLRKEAIEKYIDDNNLNNDDVLNIVVGLGRRQLSGADVSTAIVGKKDNSESKKLISFVKNNEAMKMEVGGSIHGADLAGNWGGGAHVDPADLSGVTATRYTGLVGETSAMSAGEMFSGGGKITKTREEYLENLGYLEAEVWDKIGAKSGADIRGNKVLLKKYAEAVEKIMETDGIGHGSFDQEDYDFYTDENWHLFNEFLVWNNYYEPEMTKTEKSWRKERFEKDPKSVYIADPEVITLNQTKRSNLGSFKVGDAVANKTHKSIGIVRDLFNDGDLRTDADGVVSIDELELYDPKKHKNYHIAPSTQKELGISASASKKYVPHYDIASVTVNKNGKEVTYKGSDVLNGANELKKGGDLTQLGTYIANRYVVSVTLKNGDKIKPTNGYWIKKKAPKMSRTQFEDSSYEYKDGGEVEEVIINKDGIKVKSVAMPSKKITKSEWMAKHNESKEAIAYKAGGSLEKYSQFIQDEFPRAKREANKNAKKYHIGYIVYIEKENEDMIGVATVNKFDGFPKSYIDAHEILYFTPIKFDEGGHVTFDEKSHAIAEKLEYKRVEPKYQKDYGKVYSEEEAEKAGDRIAGSMIKKEKMLNGARVKKHAGSPNMTKAVAYARANRKSGESWQSALKRGWDSLK